MGSGAREDWLIGPAFCQCFSLAGAGYSLEVDDMNGSSIKVLALIEAELVTGPAKNLIDFAKRTLNSAEDQSAEDQSHFATVQTDILTFQRSRRGAIQKSNSDLVDQSNSFIRAARGFGLEVHKIPERFRFDWRVIDKLISRVKQVEPDIIQTHNVKSHFLVRLSGLARQYRWVAFHHGYTATDAKMRIFNQLDRWSLRAAHRVVTVSKAYARHLEAIGIPGTRISIVPSAIAVESFSDLTAEHARRLRTQLGVGCDSRMILAVGRLSAEKGHACLVEAFADLCSNHPEHEARLVIVGDGPERPRLRQTADSLGIGERLILTGHVADPRPYYLAADVMILPSLVEGSPNVLLEAMTGGVPIIASRVGGVPEMIIDDVNGLLVDAKDPRSLSSTMHRVLSDAVLSRKLAANARSVAATSYAPAERARILTELYTEIERKDGPTSSTVSTSRPARCLKALLRCLYLYSGYVGLRDLILSLIGRSRAVVVYYHRVGESDALSKTVDQFRADLAYLKRTYCCMTLDELSSRLAKGVPLRKRVAVITFDDGYRDNYVNAVPLLKQAGLPATFFVATGYVGTRREFPHDQHRSDPLDATPRFAKLEWDDLRAMERDGFEIGSHTVNHTNLGQAATPELEFEIITSLAMLNARLGEKRRPFSFPWGKPADMSNEAIQSIRRAGYYAACSAYGGANARGGDPFNIMRVDVGNGALGPLATRARIAGFDPDHLRLRLGRLRRSGPGSRSGDNGVKFYSRATRLNMKGEALIRSAKSKGLTVLFMTFATVTAAHAMMHAIPGAANYPPKGGTPNSPGIASRSSLEPARPGLATTPLARTLYVSPDGNDYNTGSMSEPLGTPLRAVSIASPGDTICIRRGVYNLDRSLLIEKPGLTIRSFDRESAHLTAPIDEQEGVTSVIVVAASDVALVALEVEGGSYYGIKVDAEAGHSTTGVLIRDCRIHDTGRDCVKTFNADHLTIQDCDIGPSGKRDPSDAEGIDSIGSVGVVVRRCRIHDTATNGLYLKGGARDGIVEQCRVENIAGYGGILLGEDTDAEFMRDGSRYEAINCIARNNIVINTGAAGLATYSGSDIRFENNTLYNVAEKIQAAFWIVTNSRAIPAERIKIVNNIAVTSGSRPFVFVQNLAGSLICDCNIYFAASAGQTKRFARETTGASEQYSLWAFADWRRMMGVDSHSTIADPRLKPDDSYRPLPGSPAIGSGTAPQRAGTDYFGAVPLEKAAWDIGAVQHRPATRPAALNP
jgi:glycosyltransferase involved in cell wall biosynthesis/peptidoglycan/xylan/chitin deacetylase (PgdA/CDA1 family)